MKTRAYLRVSTIGQSLDVQLDAARDLNADVIYSEKLSGGKSDRPELLRMLDELEFGDVVVVSKLDRLARSTRDMLTILERIKDKGASLRILNINLDTATPTGMLMITMLGAIAEWEKAINHERSKEGIARAKAAGKYLGREQTARKHSAKVIEMVTAGRRKQDVADELGIGIASIYRICKSC